MRRTIRLNFVLANETFQCNENRHSRSCQSDNVRIRYLVALHANVTCNDVGEKRWKRCITMSAPICQDAPERSARAEGLGKEISYMRPDVPYHDQNAIMKPNHEKKKTRP